MDFLIESLGKTRVNQNFYKRKLISKNFARLKAIIINIKLTREINDELVSFYLTKCVTLVFSRNFFYFLPYLYQSQLVDDLAPEKLTSTKQIALPSARPKCNESIY